MILEYLEHLLVQDFALRPHYEERIVGRVYARRSRNKIAKLPFLPEAHRFSTSLLRVNKYWYEKGCRALYSMNVFEFEIPFTYHETLHGGPAKPFVPSVPVNEFKAIIGCANANRITTVLCVDFRYHKIFYFTPDVDLFRSILDTFVNLERVTVRASRALHELVNIVSKQPIYKLHTIQVLDREFMFDDKVPQLQTIIRDCGWKFSHRVVSFTSERACREVANIGPSKKYQ